MRNAVLQLNMGIVDVYDSLYRLGLTADCAGFFYTAYAVWLAMGNPDKLLLAAKWLYPDVAKKYRTTTVTVEQGIYFAVAQVWNKDPKRMRELFQVPVDAKPTPSKFLSLLTVHCMADTAA